MKPAHTPYKYYPLLKHDRIYYVVELPAGVYRAALLPQIRPWFWTYLLFGWRIGWFEFYYLKGYRFRVRKTREIEISWGYVCDGEHPETAAKIQLMERALAGEEIFMQIVA